jgi:hypothetical protein
MSRVLTTARRLKAAAAVVLYQRSITIGFLSDDYTLRAMAQSDNLGSTSGWFFRPVPLLLWRGILSVVDTPVVLHVLNIVLHGVNAFLVAALGFAMGMRCQTALGAAALFLTFPALPEAIVWAAGIQDVLMTTTALAAVVICARKTPLSGWRIVLVGGLLILGFGSKETAVCIPVLIALCCVTRARLRRDAARHSTPRLPASLWCTSPFGCRWESAATISALQHGTSSNK